MNPMLSDFTDRRSSYQSEFEAERRGGLLRHLQLFIARRQADAMLRRALRPIRPGAAARLSPHLLRDIGLPPDFRG